MATRPPATGLSYTMRRDEPTRIEGFSDAVFGFSLTLLAFSLEVPSSMLFGIFALLYRHALRQKDALALDDVELFEARAGQRVHLISVAIGMAALLLMFALPRRLRDSRAWSTC